MLTVVAPATAAAHAETRTNPAPPPVPAYLVDVYDWAYVSPRALQTFERQWLVNAILFGNYRRLRAAALDLLGARLDGTTLQIACVYGDLTETIAARLAPGGRLTVVDVLPQQIANLRTKLVGKRGVEQVEARLADSVALPLPASSVQRALLFFLLHEQPEAVRRRTLAEALRVLAPGGRLVVVDYHRPAPWNPLRPLMHLVLARLEPFALDLWRAPVSAWLPEGVAVRLCSRRLCFGGLYQVLEFERLPDAG